MERPRNTPNEMGIKRSPEVEDINPELPPNIPLPSRAQLIAAVVAFLGYSAGFAWMQFKQNRTFTGAFQADAFYVAAIASHSVATHLSDKNNKHN